MKKVLIKLYKTVNSNIYGGLWKNHVLKDKKQCIDRDYWIDIMHNYYLPEYGKNKNLTLKKEYTCDLSILIPVYNAEKYIDDCLNSIFNNKTDFSFEVICINDGSKDKSINILKKWKSKNANICVIDKQNEGVSIARNVGLENANGRYVMFVDADDLLMENAIQELMSFAAINDLEICSGGYKQGDEKGVYYQYLPDEKLIVNCDDCRDVIMKEKGYLWMRVMKRELFNNISFPVGYWFQDSVLNFLIYRKCRNYGYISKIIYYYRENRDGISWSAKKGNKVADTYYILEEMISKSNEIGFYRDKYVWLILIDVLTSTYYFRIQHLNIDLKKCFFYNACMLVEKCKPKAIDTNNLQLKKVEAVFDYYDYDGWNKYCKYRNFTNINELYF